jgi:peptidoglycan/LPS O-acetylase OafA/YrhL
MRAGAVSDSGGTGRSTGGRLDFLDALRGVAVALVLAQHVGELLFPAVHTFTTHTGAQLGQMGVTVFFLCSGFIIPASLERGGARAGRLSGLAGFWRSRFFRLYPLYWVSLAAALLLTLSGSYRPGLGGSGWLVNASMLQMFAGIPNALGLYWTLAFEMLFYLGLSALFLVRLHRHSVALALGAALVCLAVAVGEPAVHHGTFVGIFNLATMFTGTVFHRWHRGTVRTPWLALCVAATLLSGAALLASSYYGPVPPPPDTVRPLPLLLAWVGAYALFCLGIALRRRAVPAALRRLGTISYSVYLMQALVLIAVPRLGGPAGTAVLWVAVTLGVSEITHRLVERPAVRLGRRLTGSPRGLAAAAVPARPLPRGAAPAGVPAPRPAPLHEASAA